MSIISWLIGRVTGLHRSEYHPPLLPQLLALQPAILLAFAKNFISNIFNLTCSGLLLGRSKVWTYKDQNILAHPDQDIKRWACLSSGPFQPAILLVFHTVQKLRVISNKPPSTFDSCLSINVIDSYIKSIK